MTNNEHLARKQREPLRLVDVIDLLYEGKEVFFRYIREVRDVMTSDVRTLTLDNKISDGIAFLKQHHVRHIILVDEIRNREDPEKPPKKIVIGVVSHRDIARALSRNVGTLMQTDADEKALRQPLGTIMTRNPQAIAPETSIFDAVKLMIDKKFDCFPVTVGPPNEREPVGILTTTDIIKCFLHMEVLKRAREAKPKGARIIDFVGGAASSQPVELLVDSLMGRVVDVMQEAVVTVAVDAPISDAIRLMQQHRFRHLPVLDEKGRLKGIVSDRDILAFLPPINERENKPSVGEGTFRDRLFAVDTKDAGVRKALSEKVTTVMTGNPISVDPTTPLIKVVECFLSRQIGAVIVANESRVHGIVTQTDILRGILALGRLLQQQASVA